MNVEHVRLSTFSGWPENAPVAADSVAAAGFYSIGPGLLVQCFSCGEQISDWEPGDVPMARHRALNANCEFLRDPIQAGNVPLMGAMTGRWQSETSIYKSEQARLDSFADWPIPFIVRPEALAATGFYFLRQGDKVACAFCTGIINRWERGDVPKEEHRRHFPSCPFLVGLPVGNIPRSVTHCGSSESVCAELGILTHRGPRHAKYSTVSSRLKTFQERWPASAVQRPNDLAQAGFFHETEDITPGSAQDQVRCFHCDGGLRNWEPTDTPWREHARWFPTCPFLLLVKGQRFVDEVQDHYSVRATAAPPTAATSKPSVPRGHLSGLSTSMPSLSAGEASSAGGSVVGGGAEALEEENRRLRDARQCKICMDAEIGTVLLPCGHLVACVGCAPSLLDCPVCRVTIKATVRTFLS